MKSSYDVVILGAGHNGMVAASYLARAGLSVLLLEKNNDVGGATTSQRVFPDFDAQLSRYSYLVSLFPDKIIHDLGLDLELRRRETASYTPYLRNGAASGLLLSNVSEDVGRESIRRLTGSDADFAGMKNFYQLSRVFAEAVWETMLQPLPSKDELRLRVEGSEKGREAWRSLIEEPLGLAIERYLEDDLLRGLVFTDGKIGVFTHAHDPSLLQNRCFLYHLIGNKTGEWKVPVGGMGRVARELEKSARRAGATIATGVRLLRLFLAGKKRAVTFEKDGETQEIEARYLLSNFGPNILAGLLDDTYRPNPTDEGSVFKINMLLHRLPRLKDQSHPASAAFSGTFHIDESYSQMDESYRQAKENRVPERVPGEIYCHTLTDDSILSPELRDRGFHTLTLFGLDTPYFLFERNAQTRKEIEDKFIGELNSFLDEPLEDCLAVAQDGSRCLESKSPVDIEESLGLYHGNIFQTALTFPFAATRESAGTWGVDTGYEGVFYCGSSAQRGGAVSGIPGHNAAMQVLEMIKAG